MTYLPHRRHPVEHEPVPAGLVLAAGEGRRFGRAKATVEFRGRALVHHAVAVLREGGCRPVVVVSGAAHDEVSTIVAPQDATVVENPRWRDGMGSSLRRGLEAVETAGASAAVVILVDQPLLGAEAVHRLVHAWRDGGKVVVATYDGADGHPVVLDRTCWALLRESGRDEVGARELVRTHPELVTRVACDGTGIPDDIDTQDDLRRAEARLAGRAEGRQ